MQGKQWLIVCSLLVWVACGGDWKERNPYFCPKDQDCGPVDDRCLEDSDCKDPDKTVCNLEAELGPACVECTQAKNAACIGDEPICGGDNRCRGCQAHSECPSSEACLPTGACADPGQVAYVKPLAMGGTDNTQCTFEMPCTKMAKALDTGRAYVKLAGTNTEMATVMIDRNVVLLAEPGAQLSRSGNGVTVQINGSSQVEIYDLEIRDATGTGNGIGISMPTGNTASLTLGRVKVLNNQFRGISVDGGTLKVFQSTISSNSGGGISITNAAFDLTNNIIVKNGGGSSLFGGIKIDSIGSGGMRRFEFNTVAFNLAPVMGPGVFCTGITTLLELKNSIVYDNGAGSQVDGLNCSWSHSDIGPTAVAGTANINMSPMFVDPSREDYHLQAGSPAKDMADPSTLVKIDIDGDARPQGTAPDMGADEIR